MNPFTLGDVVQLPAGWDNELGLIYELYTDFDDSSKYGVSIITESGRDLGGFSYKEQLAHLTLVSRTGFEYPFRNVMQLAHDYQRGMFHDVFNMVKDAQRVEKAKG